MVKKTAAPKVKAGSMADKKMEKKMGMKPGSKADMMMEMPKKKMPMMAKGGTIGVAKGKGKWVLPSVPTLPDSNRGSPSSGTSGGISSPAPATRARAFNSVRPVVLDAMYKRAQDMLGNRVRLPGMKAGGSVKHPGFASVQNKIAKQEGISQDRAGAILAASTRRASASAVKKNPRLKKVKG